MATTTVGPTFALYVSSVEGKLVTRYGTATRGRPSYIGARRDAQDPTRVTWDTDLVVALTTAEAARYRREYQRELDVNALRRRTEQDYGAQLEREEQALAPKAATTAAPTPLSPAAPPTTTAPAEAPAAAAHAEPAPSAAVPNAEAAPAPHVEAAPHT